jgi:TRAP-type transport system periplasmic protein
MMKFINYGRRARSLVAVSAFTMALALQFGAARAQGQPFVMKISTPTINDVPDTYARNLGAALEKDSGGRIKAEIYPASQLGAIPRQIEGTQFGAIQCEVLPPEFYVGIDERFEVLAAPGLVDSLEHGQKVAADPAVLKLMLSLGDQKGLRGIGLFIAEPSVVVSKSPIRHIADFNGKKIRIFASDFQSVGFKRLGVTPVAMTLGDVLPAIQQGTIDGAVTGMGPVVHMHYVDAAKYVTLTNQPAIFLIVEVNRKWYESLPQDLQQMVDKDAAKEAIAINSFAIEHRKKAEADWQAGGGEAIRFSPDEQATLMKTLSSGAEDSAKARPAVQAAYQIVKDAAQRTR